MARSFGSALVGIAVSAYKQQQRDIARTIRLNQQVQLRLYNTQQKAQVKADKETYIYNQKATALQMTSELHATFNQYNNIAQMALNKSYIFSFEKIKRVCEKTEFVYSIPYPKKRELQVKAPTLLTIPKKSFLENIFHSKLTKRLATIKENEEIVAKTATENKIIAEKCQSEYEQILVKYEENKKNALTKWQDNETKKQNEITSFNNEIDEWERVYLSGDETAITAYFETLFSAFDFSFGTVSEHKAGFSSHSKKLLLEFYLEDKQSIFEASGYKYIQQRDIIEPVNMKVGELNEHLRSLMNGICIAAFHIAFHNDFCKHCETIVINVHQDNVCGVSGKVDKSDFFKHDFSTQIGLTSFVQLQMRTCKQATTGVKSFDTLFTNLT